MQHIFCEECEDEFEGACNFCGGCGKSIGHLRAEKDINQVVNLQHINNRIAELDSLISSKNYSKQKNSLQVELTDFLSSLHPTKTLHNATPEDVRKFIVFKERKGRTKLHVISCMHRGKPGKMSCDCPVTMAAKSVDSLIGKIRAIFRDLGRNGEWNPMLNIGNPAGAPLLKKHLQCVITEQTSAEVVSKQAVPFMFDKLARLCRHLSYKCFVEKDPITRFLYERDCAYFSLLSHTGSRGGDLGILTANRIFELPQKQGIVISQIAGKTVNIDHPKNITLFFSKDPDICPVRHLDRYMRFASNVGVNLSQGFLFRVRDVKTKVISDKPVTASVMTDRLKTHLQAINLYAGESAHSSRRGCSLALRLLGVSDTIINSHIGWGSSGMIDHYARIGSLVGPRGAATTLANAAEIKNNSSDLYQVSNQVISLSQLKRFHFE